MRVCVLVRCSLLPKQARLRRQCLCLCDDCPEGQTPKKEFEINRNIPSPPPLGPAPVCRSLLKSHRVGLFCSAPRACLCVKRAKAPNLISDRFIQVGAWQTHSLFVPSELNPPSASIPLLHRHHPPTLTHQPISAALIHH